MLPIISCNVSYRSFRYQTCVSFGQLDGRLLMTGSKYVTTIAALSVMFGIGAASAADLPMQGYSKAIAPAIYKWTGFYVGGNFGYRWERADSAITSTPAGTANTSSQDLNGAVG